MECFDSFSATLLEESKRFLEKAIEVEDKDSELAFLHASVLIGFSALEAYVNGICQELLVYEDMPLHDKSLLAEKEIELINGKFFLSDKLKIYRLKDRINFLYSKFSKDKSSLSSQDWWSKLCSSIILRNKLVHPKDNIRITEGNTTVVIESVIDCLLCLSNLIYSKPFPFKNMGMQSKLDF